MFAMWSIYFELSHQWKQNGSVLLTNERCTEQFKQTQTLPIQITVSYTNEMCELFFHHFVQNIGRFCWQPVHFAIGRICVHCSCSVDCSFVKIMLPFCFL